MSAMSQDQREQLRARLFELAEACLFDGCNPDDCPLFELRKLPWRKRLDWWKGLSEEDLAYLAAYHQVCYGLKVRSSADKPTSRRKKGPRKRNA